MQANFDMRHIRFHQYRIQVIEKWPASLEKEAALSAASAALLQETSYQSEKRRMAFGNSTACFSGMRQTAGR